MLSNVLVAIHVGVCVLGISVAFMTCLPVIGTMISNAADQSRYVCVRMCMYICVSVCLCAFVCVRVYVRA